jgi:hypothetical protein
MASDLRKCYSTGLREGKLSARTADNYAQLGAMSEPTLDNLARSYERHLRAENKSPKTVATYLEAVSQLAEHLRQADHTLADAARGDVEAFLGALLERWSAATANNRYRALKVFYAWKEDEGWLWGVGVVEEGLVAPG